MAIVCQRRVIAQTTTTTRPEAVGSATDEPLVGSPTLLRTSSRLRLAPRALPPQSARLRLARAGESSAAESQAAVRGPYSSHRGHQLASSTTTTTRDPRDTTTTTTTPTAQLPPHLLPTQQHATLRLSKSTTTSPPRGLWRQTRRVTHVTSVAVSRLAPSSACRERLGRVSLRRAAPARPDRPNASPESVQYVPYLSYYPA